MRQRPMTSLRCIAALFTLMILCAPGAFAQSVPTFSKAFSPSTIGPGAVSTLEFTITNTDGSPVRNLDFTDNFPAGMTVAAVPNAASTCQAGSLDATAGSSSFSYSGGGVGGSTSCTVRVDVTSSTPGTHTNISGDLTSDSGNSGPATADLTVATDRPGFSKAFSPSSIFFGGRSTLTLTIDNTANGAGAANLNFTDNLPPNMVVAGPANASTDCANSTLTATPGSSVVSLQAAIFGGGTVGAGASCSVSVDIVGNAIGTLGNTSGELTSTPPFGGSSRSSGKASAALEVTVERIALSKEFTDDPAAPGGTVTLEFVVRNLDRRNDAANIAFSDDLDSVVSGLAAVGLPLADPCGAGSQLTGTSVLSLTGGNLAIDETCTFSVTLQIPAAAASGEFTNTTSDITAEFNGEVATGLPASDVLFVSPVPIFTKTYTDDPVGSGSSVTLEFSITNTSSTDTATDITFFDDFATVLPTASSIPAAGFCGAGSTATYTPLIDPVGQGAIPARLLVSGASLAPGASCTFSVTLDVAVDAANGIYPNTTSAITATIDGETVTGNPASDNLEIVGAPQLIKEFTDDPVAAGGTVTLEFTLIHDENAPGDATNVSFTDDLDATLAGLVATGLPASDVCGVGSSLAGTMTLTLTGGVLAPGETCIFSVAVDIPAGAASGAYTNTTSSTTADVLGVATVGRAATDDLRVAGLSLTKEFTDDPVLPGDTTNLRFTISNDSGSESATDILFRDNLDAAVDNMTALGLPVNDICGTGSSLTALSGNTFLTFQGGTLATGESCTFDVTVEVPGSTPPDTYRNVTTSFAATINGSLVLFENASAQLVVASDLLMLEKEFTNDPVSPGENVDLMFTLTNLSDTEAVADISFTDDLDAGLAGLVNASGTLADVCGTGSSIAGTSVLTFTGGSLAAGGSCSFSVTLTVPSAVSLGTIATNVTSTVSGVVGGLFEVTGAPAMDDLRIDFVSFSKAFGGDAAAGDVVTLTFNIQNLSTTDPIEGLSFSDDLDAVLSGLTAIGLPSTDVCGELSSLTGGSTVFLSEGSLLPGASCSFSVDVQVPAGASAGTYVNVTSDLLQFGVPVAQPATADLTIIEEVDDDGDGVLNGDDLCSGTVIPESVPTITLRRNRYALVDGDTIFDTNRPPGGGPGDVFTTTDTAGCSCEQIIEQLDLGRGHTRYGCSIGAMREWVDLVSTGAAPIFFSER